MNSPFKKIFTLQTAIVLLFLGLTGLFISCKGEKPNAKTHSLFFTDSLYSKKLSEYRKHDIYLPKGFDKTKKYPIIYATDGGSDLTDKKHTLDSLIDGGIIRPLIFVASFSNDKIADSTSTTLGTGEKVYLDYRNFEYVDRHPIRQEDSLLFDRFKNHKLYFINELIPTIEQDYNQNPESSYRYFYGVSNGAGFGVDLLNTNPDLIGTYICFSVFGGNMQSYTWNENIIYPNLYLYYGSEEPFFLKDDAMLLMNKYDKLNSFIEVKEFKGGHSNKNWSKNFINVISRILATE
ncbi:esterase [Flavobacterium rakeshii]|uniref:Esterase n=1 Tax=Flavobacterium rakeshii TaxID=1038845 RepID=A0A6N8H814_9FLAO|nr:alpha/beta hydrolase-fold protein [Flavobacterium rakeshii]MEE1897855.1 alpha/beta hydrolase-fold protein [Flavobacterium rakeshii]MUV02744.1 esterase [Flavobacterium rakeshii]